MSVDDKTRNGRVCLLLLNACPVGLRRFIEHNYTTNGFARFDGFLDQWNIKHNLFHLRFKSCCSVHCTNANRSTPICTEQWDLLYKETLSRNPHGDGRKCPCMYTAIPGVTTEVMDVTLCCLLLRNCMSGGINMVHIEQICAVRNQILHSNSATLDEQTFNDIWRRLEKSLLHIAAQVSSEFHNEVRKTIKETKTSFCDNSREVCL
ncbi:hypothetical protein FSP39_017604 [Pinctada imbricata]|uniref:DZIP3-like HEPN domain-containing protein n=1 Tax=Pinctada imbricata TaxID=66713 RepID=A0AA88YIR1_PINIB|nr:hypothetical protein FSP39_017604 [Pinctada imbricata]